MNEEAAVVCDCGWALNARSRPRGARAARKAWALFRRLWELPRDANRFERVVLWKGRRLLRNAIAFLLGLVSFRLLPVRVAGPSSDLALRELVGAILVALPALNAVVCGGWAFALLGGDRERIRGHGLAVVVALALVAFVAGLVGQMPFGE